MSVSTGIDGFSSSHTDCFYSLVMFTFINAIFIATCDLYLSIIFMVTSAPVYECTSNRTMVQI